MKTAQEHKMWFFQLNIICIISLCGSVNSSPVHNGDSFQDANSLNESTTIQTPFADNISIDVDVKRTDDDYAVSLQGEDDKEESTKIFQPTDEPAHISESSDTITKTNEPINEYLNTSNETRAGDLINPTKTLHERSSINTLPTNLNHLEPQATLYPTIILQKNLTSSMESHMTMPHTPFEKIQPSLTDSVTPSIDIMIIKAGKTHLDTTTPADTPGDADQQVTVKKKGGLPPEVKVVLDFLQMELAEVRKTQREDRELIRSLKTQLKHQEKLNLQMMVNLKQVPTIDENVIKNGVEECYTTCSMGQQETTALRTEVGLLLQTVKQVEKTIQANITALWEASSDTRNNLNILDGILMDVVERQEKEHQRLKQKQQVTSSDIKRLRSSIDDFATWYIHNMTALEMVHQQGNRLEKLGEDLLMLENQLTNFIVNEDMEEYQQRIALQVAGNSKQIKDLKRSAINFKDIVNQVQKAQIYQGKEIQLHEIRLSNMNLSITDNAGKTERLSNETEQSLAEVRMLLGLQSSRTSKIDRDLISLTIGMGELNKNIIKTRDDLKETKFDLFQLHNMLTIEKVKLNETELLVFTLNETMYSHLEDARKVLPEPNKFQKISHVEEEINLLLIQEELFRNDNAGQDKEIFDLAEPLFRKALENKFASIEEGLLALHKKCKDNVLPKFIVPVVPQVVNDDGDTGSGSPELGLEDWDMETMLFTYKLVQETGEKLNISMQNIEKELKTLTAQASKLNDTLEEREQKLKRDAKGLHHSVRNIQTYMNLLDDEHQAFREMGAHLEKQAKDIHKLRQKMRQDELLMIKMQNKLLNFTVNSCKDSYDNMEQNMKISRLETQLLLQEESIEEDKNDLKMLKNSVSGMAPMHKLHEVQSATKDAAGKLDKLLVSLPKAIAVIDGLDHEVAKFIHQLPYDCSMYGISMVYAHYLSGIYLIRPPGNNKSVRVYCEVDENDNRWTIIQRRINGTEDFYRTWSDYKQGFGKAAGEYWLGNDHIHQITSTGNFVLKIDMYDIDNAYYTVMYDKFYIAGESDGYKLFVENYHGNISDAMEYHNRMKFSTKDVDNDASSSNCAMYYQGGWWYTHCQLSNLNGQYALGMTWFNKETTQWIQLSRVTMKIMRQSQGSMTESV